MLVDARWPPPDPEPDGPQFPWVKVRWPVLTIVFLVVWHVGPPLIAYVCLCAALYCAVQSFLLLLPYNGSLRDYHQ